MKRADPLSSAHDRMEKPVSVWPDLDSDAAFGKCAAGLLLIMAIPVAAGFADTCAAASASLTALNVYTVAGGKILAAPAFVFLAGLCARQAVFGTGGRFFRHVLTQAAVCLMALLAAGLSGLIVKNDWSYGLLFNRPGLLILTAVLCYTVVIRPLRRASLVLILGFALLVHIYAVLIDGRASLLVSYFPYYAAGVVTLTAGRRFEQAIVREPCAGLVSLPVVFAFFLVFVARSGPALVMQSQLHSGPGILIFGFAAAFATLAGGIALSILAGRTTQAQTVARSGLIFGRMMVPVIALWGPVILILMHLMNKGHPLPPASLILLVTAALGLVFLLVDFFTQTVRFIHGRLFSPARWPESPRTTEQSAVPLYISGLHD